MSQAEFKIEIIDKPIPKKRIADFCRFNDYDLVKAVVDVEKSIMAIGGELHADEEAVLLELGSKQKHLWGINFYPNEDSEEWIEFDSMINLRPSQGNRSRGVDDPKEREKILTVVKTLVLTDA